MKNIFIVFCVLFIGLPMLKSQTITEILNNGRTEPTVIIKKIQDFRSKNKIENNNSNFVSDQDIPRVGIQELTKEEDWIYPLELQLLRDQILSEISFDEVTKDLSTLKKDFTKLQTELVQLKIDNQRLTASLLSCCNAGSVESFGENAQAFLYQNTPNPVSEITSVSYFIPSKFKKANIQISDMSGKVMQTKDIIDFGKGAIDFDGSLIPVGSYVYSLIIDTKVIDSRIMFISK